MDSSSFLPTYDPALLEPLGSPLLDTTDSDSNIEPGLLYPQSFLDETFCSSLRAFSQSPSYSTTNSSSIDSDMLMDGQRCPGTPDDGIGMLAEESARHSSWDSHAYTQMAYTYGSAHDACSHHGSPTMTMDSMPPRSIAGQTSMLVTPEADYWSSSELQQQEFANMGAYASSSGPTTWTTSSHLDGVDSGHASDTWFPTEPMYKQEPVAALTLGSSPQIVYSPPPSPAVRRRKTSSSTTKSSSSSRRSLKSAAARANGKQPTVQALVPEGSAPGPGNAWECIDCKTSFRDFATLQKHIKAEHTRPLICVFHWAGCDSRFASKNEWKRHVISQHLALRYWLCEEGTCGQTRSSTSTRRRSASLPSVGCIFNRKDLYTQHIRRMHATPEPIKGTKSKKKGGDSKGASSPGPSEDYIRDMQARAARTRCDLPTFMTCPAAQCTLEFHGPNAWDDRMEHVACHLERASVGEEPAVAFGGLKDWTLTGWAEQAGIDVVKRTSNGWRLCNPLKGDTGGVSSATVSRRSAAVRRRAGAGLEDIEDAEGEDEAAAWPYQTPAAN